MTHAPVYVFNPCDGPTRCGLKEGARGVPIGSLMRPPTVDCPACLKAIADEDAAYLARRRAAAEQERATVAVAQALFGWMAA